MESGKLRHQVAIQSLVNRGPDGFGNNLQAWTTLKASVWAAIAPVTSRELWAGEKVENLASHKITIRYDDGIDTTMRLVFGNRVFNITGLLNDDERNIMLTLVCSEDFSKQAISYFTFHVDPINGNDSNSGLDTQHAWLTTAKADAQELTGTQSIGYLFGHVWLLYRTPNMTADLAQLEADLVSAGADTF